MDWSGLPEDIQLKVAGKLPSPFKQVCKSWNGAITALQKSYAWMGHVMCDEQSKPADLSYLPEHLHDRENILSCSRAGLVLLHRMLPSIHSQTSPLVVTNPLTRRWHHFTIPFPPGVKYAVRLHTTLLDSAQSFTVILALCSRDHLHPVKGFWLSVYKPETGWGAAHLINLGGEQLLVMCRTAPVQPLLFDRESLYFLTLPSSCSLHDSGEYTLNCVNVLGGGETFRLEKVSTWSVLPRGMWPAENRVHPKLVVCSGQILLVGASFVESGQQGPVVLLALDRETGTWRVFDELTLPGYVVKPLACKIETVDMIACNKRDGCGIFKDCFCYEDLLVTLLDDKVLLTFPVEGDDHLLHDYSYDVISKRLSRVVFPVINSEPVSRRLVTRIHFSTQGRIPKE